VEVKKVRKNRAVRKEKKKKMPGPASNHRQAEQPKKKTIERR